MKILRKILGCLSIFLIPLAFISCSSSSESTVVERYDVTFNSLGGSEVEGLNVSKDSKITKPTDPTKSGYEFVGWYKEEALTNAWFFETDTVTSNITLYAKWQESSSTTTEQYNVTFNTLGGSSVTSLVIENGEKITKPSDPSKSGYTFAGWYKEEALTNAWDFNTDTVTSDITLYAKWTLDTVDDPTGGDTPTVDDNPSVDEPVIEYYTLTFNSMGGSSVSEVEFAKNTIPSKPTTPIRSGYLFLGWSFEMDGSIYNFNTSLDTDHTLYAKWTVLQEEITYYNASNESYAIEYKDSDGANSTVAYKETGTSVYKTVDQELIRQIDDSTCRVDIVGLKAGTYDFLVTTSTNTPLTLESQTISAYDRSGYAHFNYTEGVGAYKDDGTLKDGAIVIYVTEENKDNIVVPGYETCGTGIGWILNNAQYSKAGSNTYTTNADNLGIYAITKDHPVVIRIIGKVTAPKGLTAFNSTDNGGTVKDNGFMARMKNAQNVTIEGIGEDASIFGWGIHFICADASKGGKSFEVRNITFESYPEDALGMEGVQANGALTAAVSRCWIHDNTFLPGYCASPAEKDKKEGDGSCDFKRGEYYTLSYNYFTDCHKTNLIGSSSDSLQYNVSIHHNWWNDCASRIPLARQANIHYYNNYISVSAGFSASYVISARANTYIFSEANYYYGTKNTVEQNAEGKNVGVVKSYNDMYNASYEDNLAVIATSRTQEVTSYCKYLTTNYSNFDTNENLFYYNKETGQSDCYLTTADVARADCMKYAGVNKRAGTTIDTSMNEVTPSSAVVMNSDTVTIDLSKVTKPSSTVSNVEFRNINGLSSGTIKFKGQGVTFTVTADVELSVVASASSAENQGELVRSDGKVLASKFTTLNITLTAGTYFISSGNLAKELTISSLQFKDTEASSQIRLAAYNNAIANLPETVVLTSDCYNLINTAVIAYSALTDTEKSSITNYNLVTACLNSYNDLLVNQTISLIDSIGEVTKDSKLAIDKAKASYDALSVALQVRVTNYSTLTSAITAYENFEIEVMIEAIDSLVDYNTLNITDKASISNALEEYTALNEEFNTLDSTKQTSVTNKAKLTEGLERLTYLYQPYKLQGLISLIATNVTQDDYSTIASAKAIYDALDEEQLAVLSEEETTKLEAAIETYTEALSSTIVHNFTTDAMTSTFFSIKGNMNSKTATTYEYDGLSLTKTFKIQSETEITFTTLKEMTLTIISDTAGKRINIDGSAITSTTQVYTVVIAAGDHTITKNDSMNIYYIKLV